MRIITGDECGLLKETIPELSRPKVDNPNKPQLSTQDGVRRIEPNEEQRRARGVVDMTFTSPSDSLAFAALRANGTVQTWESTVASEKSFGTYQCTGVVHDVFESAGKDDDDSTSSKQRGRPIALDSFAQKERLVAADSLGNVAVLSTKSSSPSVVTTYSPFHKQAQQTALSYTKGSYLNTNICTAMAVDNRGGRVAVGGRERETCLLDIESGNVVWKAKNLPPDAQTLLQHPVWSTALLFLNDESSGNHVMAAGTAFKQVRLYDVRTDSKTRRPIAYTPEGLLSHRVTALCQVDANQLVVGDAGGYLYSLDMRTLGKKTKGNLNLARFVGPAGSVRQVVKHTSLPIIATVGLDRMLRTFDVKKRRLIDCVYLKQRLNCLLFCNDDTWKVGEDADDKNVVEEYHGDEGDVDAEDEVQDYVDSSGDEDDDSSSEEDDDSEQEEQSNDDLEEGERSEGEESENESESDSENDEEEQDPAPRHVSKRRRV